MQKIRIKKAPQPGDQQDYSLVGRNVKFTNTGEDTSGVKNTMSATSEEKANIEVEGGEVVIGDINKDGFLEQFTFVGKKHSQGGMPVNIPEGSFIFSDTKKLKIKDTELLESVFGLKEKKGGYTPAEIAKRYQINQFVQDLKSEDTDAIQKRSAAEMLKKNTQKLGMLALVQESMKGFPDGVPAIAESVMAGLQGMQVPGMEKGEGIAHEVLEGRENSNENEQAEGMKCGGTMKKFGDGGFQLSYTPNMVIYLNGEPFKYKTHEDAWGWGTGDIITFQGPNGRTYKTNSKDLMERIDSGNYVDTGFDGEKAKRFYVESKPGGKNYYASNSNVVGKQTFKQGQQFYIGNEQYEVANPYSKTSQTFYTSGYQGTGMANAGSSYQSDVNTISVYKIDPATGKRVGNAFPISPTKIETASRNNTFAYVKSAAPAAQSVPVNGAYNSYDSGVTEKAKPSGTEYKIAGRDKYTYYKDANSSTGWTYVDTSGNKGDVTNSESVANLNNQVSGNKPAATTPKTSTQTQQPVKKAPVQNVNGKSDADIFKSFKYGGSTLNQYQDGSTVQGGPGGPQQTQPGTLNTTVGTQQQAQAASNQRIDPNKEIAVGTVTNDKGEVRYLFYKGATKIMKDANGTIIMSGPRTDTQFEQYGSKNINQILAGAPNVQYTETNFGSFANQPNIKGTGIYLSSGNAAARQSGDLSPQEWSDFQKRHGDWIDAQYPGGFAQFQKDLKSDKVTGDKATGWFQDAINEKSMKQFGVPYFSPLGQGKKEDNPYYRDSKFGQVTYSVPRFFDAPKKPEEPGQETAYFCVEYTDGTKNVVSVSHKTGEQPVPPSGGNIKTVGAASKDKGTADGQCIGTPTKTFEKQPKKEGPWWLQDIVNFVGTATDQVNRYEPTQGKIDLVTPGYDLLDPTRKLAANQEQMARYQNQVQNTADGNVGLATTLGASGEGFANAANVLDTTEAANIGIVNQAYNTNAQIQNQEIVGNETARQKYVEDMATLNQQYDNALQQKKWREIAAFNNGTTNWFRKKQMENVLFPQVYIDPILGDVDFSGKGREILGENGTGMAPDVYQNPYGAGRSGAGTGYDPSTITQTSNAAWKKAYDEALPTRGEEGARKHADEVSKMYLQTAKQTPTWQNNFQQAYMSGMTLPASFNATPWEEK
jgi:hypothetical protein